MTLLPCFTPDRDNSSESVAYVDVLGAVSVLVQPGDDLDVLIYPADVADEPITGFNLGLHAVDITAVTTGPCEEGDKHHRYLYINLEDGSCLQVKWSYEGLIFDYWVADDLVATQGFTFESELEPE